MWLNGMRIRTFLFQRRKILRAIHKKLMGCVHSFIYKKWFFAGKKGALADLIES